LLQTDKDSALDAAIKENPRLISLRNEQARFYKSTNSRVVFRFIWDVLADSV
jgi:hypothetical protein